MASGPAASHLTAARAAKIKLEMEFIQLKMTAFRAELLHREKLEAVMQDVMTAIVQIINASRLTSEEKQEIFQNLGSIPVAIDQARKSQIKELLQAEDQNKTGEDTNGHQA